MSETEEFFPLSLMSIFDRKIRKCFQVKARVDRVADALLHVVIDLTITKFSGHKNGAFLIDHMRVLKQDFFEATNAQSVLSSYHFT